MRIITRNYDDFRTLIKGLFGEMYTTFYGTKPTPHEKVVVVATNGNVMVIFTSPHSLPDSFNQEFVKALCISDMSEVEWPR